MSNQPTTKEIELKAKVFDELVNILNDDNGVTAINFNSSINLAKANVSEYECSYAIIQVMEQKKELFQKLYSTIINHYN